MKKRKFRGRCPHCKKPVLKSWKEGFCRECGGQIPKGRLDPARTPEVTALGDHAHKVTEPKPVLLDVSSRFPGWQFLVVLAIAWVAVEVQELIFGEMEAWEKLMAILSWIAPSD